MILVSCIKGYRSENSPTKTWIPSIFLAKFSKKFIDEVLIGYSLKIEGSMSKIRFADLSSCQEKSILYQLYKRVGSDTLILKLGVVSGRIVSKSS